MPTLSQNLLLNRCPHCSIANPNLFKQHAMDTRDYQGQNRRWWYIYTCGRCGGVVSASAPDQEREITAHFPSSKTVRDDIPERPRTFLQQALESLHAPSGAVMLAASAVDAMLKAKGYTEGSLYARIETAAKDYVITSDKAKWAHYVRLDANDQRHADTAASLPTKEDASRAVDFATALAESMFVLPARVQRGIREAHAKK